MTKIKEIFKSYYSEFYTSWKTNWAWLFAPLFVLEMISLFCPSWWADKFLPSVYSSLSTWEWIVVWLCFIYFLMIRHTVEKQMVLIANKKEIKQIKEDLEKTELLNKKQTETIGELKIKSDRYDLYHEPKGALKQFLKLKIEQGKKLYESDLEDVLTRKKLSINPSTILTVL